MSILSDEELFSDFISTQNETVFETLLKRYQQPLYHYLIRYTGDANLAEDIFQETFVKVYQKRHLYKEDKTFKPWLYCIAINTAKDKFRERKLQATSLAEQENSVADAAISPVQEITGREIGEKIAEAVARLPELQRQVFVLRQYEKMSYADISATMQRPLNTVKSDMRRALQLLRNLLDSFADVVMEEI